VEVSFSFASRLALNKFHSSATVDQSQAAIFGEAKASRCATRSEYGKT